MSDEFTDKDDLKTAEKLKEDQAKAELLAKLDQRKFDVSTPVPDAPPVFTLNNIPIATQGNVETVQGKQKAGKTAIVLNLIAASLKPAGNTTDTLGIEGRNAAGKALIHFDCEQSPADADKIARKALRKVGLNEQPRWLRSYRLVDLDIQDRKNGLQYEIERAAKEHNGIFAVIIDGVADLLGSLNDEESANKLIAWLHKLASTHATVIFLIIHENPSSSDGGKTRGHLGSGLGRKSETNLVVKKDGEGISTLYAEDTRHTPIYEKDGARFKWSNEAGMHVSTDTKRVVESREKHKKLVSLAQKIFKGIGSKSYTDLCDKIGNIEKIQEAQSKRRITEMTEVGVIEKDIIGHYTLSEKYKSPSVSRYHSVSKEVS